MRTRHMVEVETTDPAAFAREVAAGREIFMRIGVEARLRAWQATYAGSDVHRILLTLEFADGTAFARSETAFSGAIGDAEFEAWVARLDDMRKTTYDALHVEL
jgi:hypothetical protein